MDLADMEINVVKNIQDQLLAKLYFLLIFTKIPRWKSL